MFHDNDNEHTAANKRLRCILVSHGCAPASAYKNKGNDRRPGLRSKGTLNMSLFYCCISKKIAIVGISKYLPIREIIDDTTLYGGHSMKKISSKIVAAIIACSLTISLLLGSVSILKSTFVCCTRGFCLI